MMWHVTVGCSMLEPLPQGMHDHRVSFAENEARRDWSLMGIFSILRYMPSGVTRNSGASGQNIRVGPLPWISTISSLAMLLCMEVRGIVVSTVAPWKVSKIEFYFCRWWFILQNSELRYLIFMRSFSGGWTIIFANRVPRHAKGTTTSQK